MRALSLHQPWASLIADARKTIETRSWELLHRGPLAIHGAQKVDAAACHEFGYDPHTIPRGAVVCVVSVIACVRFPHPGVTPDDYGDFHEGRYGFMLKLLEVFKPAIPARGFQGLWYWNYEKEKPCNEKPLTAV